MADEVTRRSALAGCEPPAAAGPAVSLAEQAPLAHWVLRGDPATLGKALALPEHNNTFGRDDERGVDVYWRGPDEWLLVGADGFDAKALGDALQDSRHALVDVSSGQTVIEVAGPGARDTLAAGCTLDLHPDAFRPGDCAQTLIAGCSVLLARHAGDDDDAGYRLVVRRSFAAHLWLWLHDAARQSADA